MTLDAPPPIAIPDSPARLRAALSEIPEAACLLPALEALDWVMPLPNAAAPGFVYLAGAFQGSAVGGGGGDLLSAAGRLCGEASEIIAQSARPSADTTSGDPRIDKIWATGAPRISRVGGMNLVTGLSVGVPTSAIFVDPEFEGERCPTAPPRSLGLGAGRDSAAARLSGLLELIERDAAARWWLEGVIPRALDVSILAETGQDLARMRAGSAKPGRPTTFLDLNSETGIPVICACSRDPDGTGLCLGFKASLSVHRAVQGALMELLQMEIALDIARHRQTRGQLAAGDIGPLSRASLDPDTFPAFAARPPLGFRQARTGLDDLIAHLATLGHEVIVTDLDGLSGGLKVAKVFVPSLRPMPGGAPGPLPDTPGTLAELM